MELRDLRGKRIETRHNQYKENPNGKHVPISLFHISHAFYIGVLRDKHLKILEFVDTKWVASGTQIIEKFNLKFAVFKRLIDDLVDYNLLVEKKILDGEEVLESYYKLTYNAHDVMRDMRSDVVGFTANILEWIDIAENGKENFKSKKLQKYI